MSTAARTVGAVLLLAAASPLAAPAAGESTGIRVNPFVQPEYLSAPARPAAPPSRVQPTRAPSDLRFTLSAGADSLVSVDGTVLRIGEEIGGYRLDEVHEGAAVFSHEGRQLILTVHEPAAGNQDD